MAIIPIKSTFNTQIKAPYLTPALPKMLLLRTKTHEVVDFKNFVDDVALQSMLDELMERELLQAKSWRSCNQNYFISLLSSNNETLKEVEIETVMQYTEEDRML